MGTFWIILAMIELVVIIAGAAVWFLGKKKKDAMVDSARQLAKGKLNIDDIPASRGNSSEDVIATGLNLIKSNMLTFVESTKQNTVVLSDAIDRLTENMKANQEGTEMIANNTISVEERTSKQLEMVEDNKQVMESNSDQLNEISDSMTEIGNMLGETAQMSNNGMETLEGYNREMDVVSEDLNNINDTLVKFNDQIQKVYEVGDFIVDISTQLKLLSFNASIEAARAGETGRGFAVVAGEMTGMSEQTKEGMDRISTILTEIMTSSAHVTESINKVTESFNESKATFSEVNSSFRAINSNSTQIQTKIIDINKMFSVMEDNFQRSKDIADQMYETAKDINESTEDIAAASQEVTAEATQIGENTAALDDMLKGIRKLIGRFDTGVMPENNRSGKEIKIGMLSMNDNDFWWGVKRGANYAVKELAAFKTRVTFMPINPGDDGDKVRGYIQSFIDQKYDAIVYPGFLGGVEKVFEQARSKGIKLMTFNCDCANPKLRLACLKSDSVAQGALAAKSAAELIGKSGNVGILMGNDSIIGNVERRKGFVEGLGKYKSVKMVGEISVKDDSDDVYKKTKEFMSKHPDVQILFLTNGFPEDAARAVVDAGRKGKTKVVGFDLNPGLFPYIKNGAVGSIISQDSFGQGHDPIVLMYNHIAANTPFPGETISCRASVADASNIDELIEA